MSQTKVKSGLIDFTEGIDSFIEFSGGNSTVTGNLTVTGTLVGYTPTASLNISNWDTAYGWGNHASAGYLTSFDITTQTDAKYLRSDESDTMSGSLTVTGGLTTGGNVGIGTTSPVNTYSGLTISGSDPSLALKTTSASGWVWTQYVNSSGVNNFSMGVNQTIPYWAVKAGAGLDSPHLLINASGNVGIGTTSPTYKLDVSGDARATGNLISDFRLQLPNMTIGYWDGLYNRIESGSSRPLFITAYSQPIYMGRDGSIGDFTLDTSGRVGIGTTSPSYKLDVSGTGRFSDVLNVFVSGNNTRLVNFSTSTYGSARGLRINSYISSGGGEDCGIEFDSGVGGYGGFKFSNSGTPNLTINQSGYVGINTTSPQARLDVRSAGDTVGTSALLVSAGNSATNFDSNQIRLAYNGSGDYSHAIKTRHHSNDYLNAIDFYVWKYGTDAAGSVGTQHVMTLIQGGDGSAGTGRVGIGTTSPSGKFHIDHADTYSQGILHEYVSTYVTRTKFGRPGTTSNLEIYYDIAGAEIASITRNYGTAQLQFKRGSTVDMLIDGTGKVGIGTTTPFRKFQVDGHAGVRNGSFFIGDESGSTDSGIEFYKYGTTLRMYTNTGAFGGTYGSAAVNIDLFDGGTYSTRISGNGNSYFGAGDIGIGTTSPNAPLEVTSKTTDSSGVQQWSYNTAPSSYRLQLNTVVTSGLVKWSFDMLNAGAGYNNVLVLDRGKVGIGTVSPSQKLEVAGGFKQSGVTRYCWSGYTYGTSAFDLDISHVSQSSFKITCVMNHYGIISSYGCARMALVANGPGIAIVDITNVSNGNSGSWEFTRVNDQKLRVSKIAGSYSGGGYYFVEVVGHELF